MRLFPQQRVGRSSLLLLLSLALTPADLDIDLDLDVTPTEYTHTHTVATLYSIPTMASLSFDTEHSEMIVRVVLHLPTRERSISPVLI